ncbi:glycoside hydrolase family 88/105 protein [Arachidicoccus sp.]|uniref:glycoside hydrolase family 88/105 protein n=1 Tax=Arachidicoccus sp. TaxID=1872624 RepID=UPI003D23993A
MIRKSWLIVAVTLTLGCSTAKKAQDNSDKALQPKEVMSVMQRVADWQIAEISEHHIVSDDWTYGALYTGILAYGNLTGNKKYDDFLIDIGNKLDWNTGKRRFMADDYCVGQMYSILYSKYKKPKMLEKFIPQADSIIAKPHTESLVFKGDSANREWAWCDALFMGPPSLAYLATATKNLKYLNIANKLWWKTTDFLYDTTAHLYYRDSRYFDKKEANGKEVFWSRGNGWVMGGLVRMLDNMPTNYPDRAKYETLYRQMAQKVASLITADGTWHASLLDPASFPSKETSGSGFYCYALAWGIRHGLLPYKEYFPVVKKSWDALVSCVHPNGKLGFVQEIGAAPGKTTFDDTQVYGVGAFLLAGTELYLLERHK